MQIQEYMGYTYSITGTSNISETSLVGNKQKLIFETDGTFTLIIKAIDRAGNISNAYTLTVYKDATEPNEFVPNISNITNNSLQYRHLHKIIHQEWQDMNTM